MMHAALQEGAIFEHLAVDLPVGVIEAGLQQRGQIGVEEGRPDRRILGDDLAARMAARANIEFLAVGRRRALRCAGLGVHAPDVLRRRFEPDRQAQMRVVRGAPRRLRVRPIDMARAGAVAGLAGDVHVAPRGRIGVGAEIIVLFEVSRVAGGALIVPGLVAPGPVQRAARRQRLVRIKMHPALAALILRPAVPGDSERLIAPARKGDQILLQRIDAERIGDLHNHAARRPALRCAP